MKKKYTAPDMQFINLSINQAVCSACSVEATLAAYVCAVEIPGLGTIFNDESVCEFTNDIDICYHTPLPSSNVFSS